MNGHYHVKRNGKDISSTNETVDWRKVYQTSTACTRSSKLIDFNFRFLHRRLATNCYLQKLGIREDNTCTFCHNEKEDLMHLFWQCEKTTMFWQNLSLWLQSCQILTTENNLHLETALGLKPDSSNFKLQINFCCLLPTTHLDMQIERTSSNSKQLLNLSETYTPIRKQDTK